MSLLGILFEVAVADAVIRSTRKLGESKDKEESKEDKNKYEALGVR